MTGGEVQRLTLTLKAERTYLQGPDMYTGVLDCLSARHGRDTITAIDISFHRMAHRAVDLHFALCPHAGQPVAVCSYRAGAATYKVFLYESADAVTGRSDYDEAAIVRHLDTDVESMSGSWKDRSSYCDMEVWVALTKALHQRALPELSGKWLFARGQFPSYQRESADGERRLQIVSNFQNRLTRTMLYRDGVAAGVIYFSLTSTST